MTNTEQLSNKDLDQAIRTIHRLIQSTAKSDPLDEQLRKHLTELLQVQILRANEYSC